MFAGSERVTTTDCFVESVKNTLMLLLNKGEAQFSSILGHVIGAVMYVSTLRQLDRYAGPYV